MLQPTVSRLNISNHYNDLMCEVSALVELMGNVAGSMDRSDDEMSTGDMAFWGVLDSMQHKCQGLCAFMCANQHLIWAAQCVVACTSNQDRTLDLSKILLRCAQHHHVTSALTLGL